MLVGMYGGTFDPVHVGHIHAALSVQKALQLQQVRLVLAARPGHRGEPDSTAVHRWQMLCLACAEHETLVPDDVELKRAGKSYTIDTVAQLRKTNPAAIPCWIMGQDAFATLPTWYRWQSLLSWCNLIVVARPGDERPEPPEVAALCKKHEVATLHSDKIGQIARLDLPMLQVSATQIRRLVAAGEPVEHLLADPVYTYIRQHRLYVKSENTI